MQNLQFIDWSVLEDRSEVCKNCLNFKDFGERCWYFWEGKKDCSQKLSISENLS